MSLDQDISTRFVTGADLWNPLGQVRASSGYAFPPPYSTGVTAPPRRPPQILVSSLLKSPTPQHAVNGARPLSEFIQAQQAKAAKRKPQRRRRRAQLFDPRLWLSNNEYAAWSIAGEVVVVLDPEFRSGRGSPVVRRPTPKELHDLLAVDRLIVRVIALYRGDSLDKTGVVTRYMQHYDLDPALQAALERALEVERKQAEEQARLEAERRPSQKPKLIRPLKKSRFHPGGNFVIYVPPTDDDDLPEFAIKLPGLGMPKAFEDKRKAQQFLNKQVRLGRLPLGCRVTRVMAAVKARPVFRQDLNLPDDLGELLALLRREPSIVRPELHLEWLPRFVQHDDGEWRPQEFSIRRTVRHQCRRKLLERLHKASEQMTQAIETSKLRQAIHPEWDDERGQRILEIADEYAPISEDMDPSEAMRRLDKLAQRHHRNVQEVIDLMGPADDLSPQLKNAMCVLWRAQRGLSQTWKEKLGAEQWGIGPDWQELAEMSHCPPHEEGHCIRAPHEGTTSDDRTRRYRTVELRIDDLAGLLEEFGMEVEFWLVKDSTTAEPRWVLPVPALDAAMAATNRTA